MDPRLIAQFPFLTSAKTYLKAESVSYDDLEAAKNFVLDSLKNSPQNRPHGPEEAVKTLTLARLMLACIGNEFISRKFAASKAKEYTDKIGSGLETIATDFMPSLEKKPLGQFSVSLGDYLKYGPNLAKQELENGRVFLSENNLLRLTEHAIGRRLEDTSTMNMKNVPKEIREAADELNAQLPRQQQIFKGKLLSKQCMQKILHGVGEGKRYYGSFALSIACLKDNLTKEKAYEVLQDYVNNCRGTSPFTFREAQQVVDWVYAHPTIGFSCKTLIAQGLIDNYCPDCVNRRRGQ